MDKAVTTPVIAICIPVRDMIHPSTFRSIMSMDIPRPFHLLDVRDIPVDSARNAIVGKLLSDPSITHALWIDDDMVFDPDVLKRLLAHDLPIVGGLCHNRRDPYVPILIRKMDNGLFSFMMNAPKGLVSVDATGAAFLLVKREVFEAIETRFPGEGAFTVRDRCGEDVSFCFRAADCGFKTYVDTTVEIGHVAEVIVTSTFAARNRSPMTTPPGSTDGGSTT